MLRGGGGSDVGERSRAFTGRLAGGHEFRSIGALRLKGLGDPVPAAAVIRSPVAAPVAATVTRRAHRWPALLGAIVVVAAGVTIALVVRGGSGRTSSTPPARGYTPRYEPKRCSADLTKVVPQSVCGELVVPRTGPTRPIG